MRYAQFRDPGAMVREWAVAGESVTTWSEVDARLAADVVCGIDAALESRVRAPATLVVLMNDPACLVCQRRHRRVASVVK